MGVHILRKLTKDERQALRTLLKPSPGRAPLVSKAQLKTARFSELVKRAKAGKLK
jgi:hypothetical protein